MGVKHDGGLKNADQYPYYRPMAEQPLPQGVIATEQRSQSARVDKFVDGAFAFAITLLVLSGASLPRNVDALMDALRGVPAFAVCFVQLVWFWHGHVSWREMVDRTDMTGLCLSLLLVFFALIFVFPLHLVYASFFHGLTSGVLSPGYVPVAAGAGKWHHLRLLFACYGICNACMAGTLSALLVHGARRIRYARPAIWVDMRLRSVMWAFVAAVGLLSLLLAVLLPSGTAIALAGLSYCLLALTGVVATWGRRHFSARQAVLVDTEADLDEQ
ncbi:MAG TPA: TMEM175 family protein [Rhodanobacteraceae bacterium]